MRARDVLHRGRRSRQLAGRPTRLTGSGRSEFTVDEVLSHPAANVFAVLADPRRRPEWQASLRRVELLSGGPPGAGTRWYDVTVLGVRPLLEITTWESDERWVEHGTWRGVAVDVEIGLTAARDGTVDGDDAAGATLVRLRGVVHAPGWRIPIGWALRLLAPRTARADLRRLGRLLR